MNKPWHDRPMRIAALQCNFEKGRTLAVADRWQRMGFNTEQVFHPMADHYSSLFDLKKHGALLTAYLRRLKRHHIRAILYMNVHILGPSMIRHKGEWAQRAADGSFPLFYDTYPPCCINSPWRDYYFRALASLASFEIDGVFLDGPAFIAGGCHCRHCQARYRREEGRVMTKNADLSKFCQRSTEDFLRESYRRFKRIKAHGAHYMNLPALHPTGGHIRLPEALAYNDIVGTEGGFQFYGAPRNAPLHKPSLTARVLEALAPDKPRVIFMAGDQKPWSWLMHTPVETKLCIAGAVANGASLWYGLHGSTRLLDTPGGKAGGEMIRFLARHEDVFDGAMSEARTGLMYSYVTERSYRTGQEPSDFYGQDKSGRSAGQGDAYAAFQGMGDLLIRASVPFDVVTDLAPSLDKLRRYQCLILPTCACLDRNTVAVIREYVARGGHLISTFDTSLFDERGKVRRDFALADVFNAHCEGRILKMQTFNYFEKCAEHPIWKGLDNPLVPAPTFGLAVKAGRGAKVLARFLKPMAGRYVPLTQPESLAVVLNQFGKGHSLYLAGTFGEMAATFNPPDHQRLMENALALFVRQPVTLEGALGNVEMVVRSQAEAAGRKSRWIIHLINHAGLLPRPYRKVYPQYGLSLRVRNTRPFTRARALVAGCACHTRTESGSRVIALPELKEYEIVVAE